MEKLANILPTSPQTNSLQRSGSDMLATTEGAINLARSLLRTFPDFDKSTKELTLALAAKLESLDPEMRRRVLDPVNGIASKQAYAPTPFHIEEFVKAASQFKPVKTNSGYRRFADEAEPAFVEEPVDHRKQVVLDTLGYNPQDRKQARPQEYAFKPGREVFGDHHDLLTPPKPASAELKRLIASRGM